MDINNIEDEYFIEKKSFAVQENNYSKAVIPLTKFSNDQIVVDKIKYDHETMKVLIDNYKYYQKDEYSRILNEFRQIVLTYNNT